MKANPKYKRYITTVLLGLRVGNLEKYVDNICKHPNALCITLIYKYKKLVVSFDEDELIMFTVVTPNSRPNVVEAMYYTSIGLAELVQLIKKHLGV